MSFKNWAPLKFIDSNLLSQIRLAYVFGKTGQEVIFVTDDDDVFACGPNFSNCLGLGTEGPQIIPKRIPELCQKKVKGFLYCHHTDDRAFIFAYCYDKTIYFWGKFWKDPQLFQTPTKSKFFNTKEAANGRDFCIFLTTDGQIQTRGSNSHNQLGRSSEVSSSVGVDLQGKMAVKVSCGAYFSVAVDDSGEVFAWGSNSDGQLGINVDDCSSSMNPRRISDLSNTVIEKITCGECYVIAVSDVGELFSWGQNHVGQLGLGDTTSRFKPTKIKNFGKVIDIAATCYGSTTAAMTENNEVYMWGDCGDLKLLEPTITQFETVFDVFAFLANPRIMPRPMTRTIQLGLDSVGESINNAFGDAETSDLIIVAEGKEILVHKVILRLRSNYFKVLLNDQWLNDNKKSIEIQQSYDAIYAYFRYLYCGKFEGSPEEALELLKIADEYNDLILKEICENRVIHGITVENVTDLYNMAIKLNTENLAHRCVLFATKHMGKVIETVGFREWNATTHQEFTIACHKHKMFKYSK